VDNLGAPALAAAQSAELPLSGSAKVSADDSNAPFDVISSDGSDNV
jgi:hypothetical protein